MATKPQSVSARELAGRIHSAVQAALRDAKIKDPETPRPIIINWQIIGFILREEELEKIGQLDAITNQIAKSAAGAQEIAALTGGRSPTPGFAAFLGDKRIICGFLPGPLPIALS
jgi:hypothetical protein